MADDKQDDKPTPEQIETANQAEAARWQGDFKEEDLTIPYKREDADGKNDKSDDDTSDKSGDADIPKGNDTSEKDGNDDTDQYTDPAPILTVDDPGDYQPADYSFEVTLAGGKTVKVTSPDEADKLADDPDNFETPKQLNDFLKKSLTMQHKLDRDYEKWEAQKKTFTEQLETETQRREAVDTIASEMSYLVDKGMMPKVDKQYIDADWSDPEVAKQPGVKEQIELLQYMVKENESRAKAKIKPLSSILDAYNAWQLDAKHQKEEADRKKAEEEHKAAGEARKQAGARVAGVSPSSQGTYTPKGIAVGNPNVFKRGAAQWED